MAPLAALAMGAYLVFCFFFFNVPGVVADAQWERASTYIADWYSWEATPRFRFKNDGIELEWTRSLLGDNPDPDWIEQNGAELHRDLRRRGQPGRDQPHRCRRRRRRPALPVPITGAGADLPETRRRRCR